MRARIPLGFAPVYSKVNFKKQPEQIASLVVLNDARETLSLSLQDTDVAKIEMNTPPTRKQAILLKLPESPVCCTFLCPWSLSIKNNAAVSAECSDVALALALQGSLALSRTT